MDTGMAHGLPASLEQVRRRFERWRETRKAPARIPDSLWASAIRMAGSYGLSKTANALGINYERLKNRLAATPDLGPASTGASKRRRGREPSAGGRAREGGTRFVELPALASTADHFLASGLRSASGECFLEWEDGSGAKLRLRLQGIAAADLAMLCRSFRP